MDKNIEERFKKLKPKEQIKEAIVLPQPVVEKTSINEI